MRNNIVNELRTQLEQLKKILTTATTRLADAPEGSLSVQTKNGHPRFYRNIYNKASGKKQVYYLGRNEKELIRSLAQKSFDLRISRAASEQADVISGFLNKYDEQCLKKIFLTLSTVRKELIDAPELDDEQYARQWQEKKYMPKDFLPGAPEIYSMRGERVRSKSEKIIADFLYMEGIPYRYEPPVKINGQLWRPDFVILDIHTRREIILEHFGMMDDPDYCKNALAKISIYIQNEIYPGEKLLLSFESKSHPLSPDVLNKMVLHHLSVSKS